MTPKTKPQHGKEKEIEEIESKICNILRCYKRDYLTPIAFLCPNDETERARYWCEHRADIELRHSTDISKARASERERCVKALDILYNHFEEHRSPIAVHRFYCKAVDIIKALDKGDTGRA